MNAYHILSQNAFWRINKAITRLIGDLDASVMLSYLVDKENYHKQQGSIELENQRAWFYATAEAIEEETTLSRYKQGKALAKLADYELITTSVRGVPATKNFAINHELIVQVILSGGAKDFKTSFKETSKLDLKKLENYHIYKNRRVRGDSPPENGLDVENYVAGYQGGTEDDYQAIYDKIAEHLNANAQTWKQIAGLAMLTLTPKQFKEEIEGWIRYRLTDKRLYQNPVKHLRGGPISFVAWLKKPWARDKYSGNGQAGGNRKKVSAVKKQP